MSELNFKETCQLETIKVRALTLDEINAISGGMMPSNPIEPDIGGNGGYGDSFNAPQAFAIGYGLTGALMGIMLGGPTGLIIGAVGGSMSGAIIGAAAQNF